MARFDDYAQAYQTLVWNDARASCRSPFIPTAAPYNGGSSPHREFGQAFRDIGSDFPENKVVIMTGTGEAFSGPRATPDRRLRRTASDWDRTYWEGGAAPS